MFGSYVDLRFHMSDTYCEVTEKIESMKFPSLLHYSHCIILFLNNFIILFSLMYVKYVKPSII